ncbi:chitinase [Romboutsia sp.]|uniref:chitinase n=1 Tax=Romboutsia sp. TaxID=1965302 RepID=UPI003F3C7D6D
MSKITNYEVQFIEADWHNLKCSNKKNCNRYKCNCNCKSQLPKNVILTYVYKEQIYYIRCLESTIFNFFPSFMGNGSTYLMHNDKTYISSSFLAAPILSYNKLGEVPVIYPEYSSTDVGKGKKWPAKVFSPFVDTTAWPTYSIVDDFKNLNVPYFNLGFIVTKSYNVCQPSWATYYPAESGPMNDQIKEIRSLGGDVCVSFGGAAGMPIHINCPDANSLFNQYKLFCDAYGLTRIDFDLEGTWISPAYATQNTNNSNALKMLQDYYISKGSSIDIWFTLPILPQGLTDDGINILKKAISAGVNISGVNAMTMDYGDSAAPNPAGKMGSYGIQAITSLYNQLNTLYNGSKTPQQLWSMIGTTPMLGVNDVITEIFGLADATQTLNFAKQNSIGMISMWSANRDLSGSSATGIPQQPNDFTKIFNAYN